MRKLVGVLGLVLVIILGGFVWLKRDYLFGFGKQAMRSAAGLTPAKTPQEAVDKFRIAIQKNDYEAAASYLTGDYAEQMNRGSASATKLAEAIDSLAHQMKTREKTSEQAQYTLRMLAPFPTEFEVDIKKQGDDKAVGVITDKSAGGFSKINPNDLPKLDPLVAHALFPQAQLPFEFKQEGSGSEKHWKMNFPMHAAMSKSVEKLNAKSSDYVQALKKVTDKVQHEPMTGKDVESELKTNLEPLAK
jgi:hypothetical protein